VYFELCSQECLYSDVACCKLTDVDIGHRCYQHLSQTSCYPNADDAGLVIA